MASEYMTEDKCGELKVNACVWGIGGAVFPKKIVCSTVLSVSHTADRQEESTRAPPAAKLSVQERRRCRRTARPEVGTRLLRPSPGPSESRTAVPAERTGAFPTRRQPKWHSIRKSLIKIPGLGTYAMLVIHCLYFKIKMKTQENMLCVVGFFQDRVTVPVCEASCPRVRQAVGPHAERGPARGDAGTRSSLSGCRRPGRPPLPGILLSYLHDTHPSQALGEPGQSVIWQRTQ